MHLKLVKGRHIKGLKDLSFTLQLFCSLLHVKTQFMKGNFHGWITLRIPFLFSGFITINIEHSFCFRAYGGAPFSPKFEEKSEKRLPWGHFAVTEVRRSAIKGLFRWVYTWVIQMGLSLATPKMGLAIVKGVVWSKEQTLQLLVLFFFQIYGPLFWHCCP